MVDELLCNVLRVKIQIYFHDFFLKISHEERCTVVSTIGCFLWILPFSHFHGDLPRFKWGPLMFFHHKTVNYFGDSSNVGMENDYLNEASLRDRIGNQLN